ncbi:hypothetical protein SNE40_003194 [Patella caerulea]|uniref:Uncharacterized protein n=1 Tax=Patella caerulea TaxID=87958 RepID=A0AAN8KFP0_PATCE
MTAKSELLDPLMIFTGLLIIINMTHLISANGDQKKSLEDFRYTSTASGSSSSEFTDWQVTLILVALVVSLSSLVMAVLYCHDRLKSKKVDIRDVTSVEDPKEESANVPKPVSATAQKLEPLPASVNRPPRLSSDIHRPRPLPPISAKMYHEPTELRPLPKIPKATTSVFTIEAPPPSYTELPEFPPGNAPF